MNGTITFIVDNIAEKPFIAEHGLAILIETAGQRILFDTGEGKALFHNAQKLGISLSGLNTLVLSHGHYDHGGNIAKIISLNPTIQLFAHPDCLVSRWSLHSKKKPKSVGLSDKDKEAIKNLPKKQITWCDTPTKVTTDVWLTGRIERNNDFEDVGGDFYLDETAAIPDLIPDDISLWVKGPNGLTIVCGCCHSGVKNTLETIINISGLSKIDRLIGGLHLLNANTNRIEKTLFFINNLSVREVIPAHCTGKGAIKTLQKNLDAEAHIGSVGLKIEI